MIIRKLVSSILTIMALLFVLIYLSAAIVYLDTEDNKKGSPQRVNRQVKDSQTQISRTLPGVTR